MKYIKEAKNVVCILGAGMSTASGIPDFNGPNGLYKATYKGYDPAFLLNVNTLAFRPKLFYEFFREKLLVGNAKPNAGHYALKELADMGKLKAVITQNIDGLELVANIPNTYQVHGTIEKYFCVHCGLPYTKEQIKTMQGMREKDGVPICSHCGKLIRPQVTLYGENLDHEVTSKAQEAIYNSDLVLVIGTSFQVYPVASYLDYYNGKVVVINQGDTTLDGSCDLKIEEPAELYLPKLVNYLKADS